MCWSPLTCGKNTSIRCFAIALPDAISTNASTSTWYSKGGCSPKETGGLGLSGGVGTGKNHQRPPIEMKYYEGRKGGFDPHARIADLDLDASTPYFSILHSG